jgi:hypothetical protein
MSITTTAIIRKGTALKEIKEVLEVNYGVIIVHSISQSSYFRLVFNDGNEVRILSVFLDDTAKIDHNIDGVLLMLGYREKSVEIMKILLNEFGGYLCENDYNSEDFYPINLDKFEKSTEITEMDLLTNEIIQKLGYDKLDVTLKLFKIYQEINLNKISDSLNDEISKINTTILKDDSSKLDTKSDSMQIKSFSRGKSLGLIIARDRLNELLS